MLYVKNLTLAEIGEVLGVSESRVCQIHSALKRTLRDHAWPPKSDLYHLVGAEGRPRAAAQRSRLASRSAPRSMR